MNRRGFTLAEIIVVLSVLSIVAGIAAPKAQEAVARARAAALLERVAGVRTAYESVDEPTASALQSPPGTVPPLMSAALAEGAFRGEGGIELNIVGAGPNVYLRLRSTTPAQHRIREAFHLLADYPHIHTASVTLVPLGTVATTTVVRPVSTGTRIVEETATPVKVPQQQVVLKVGASADTFSTALQPAHQTLVLRPAASAVESTKTTFTPGAPPCSPSLPPDRYRECQPQGTSGWFRQ